MAAELGFSFAGRTIDYFGSKSITSDITALFELIKNSRDANSRKVSIHFKNLKSKTPEIEVYDNGDGMSEEDIREKWMVIGTNSRLQDAKTKSGKPVWGEMGIGRMACQKLCDITELDTVKNGKRIVMIFDWSQFEKKNIKVDEIKFPIEISNARGVEKGTTLRLKSLKSKWTREKIDELKEELSMLISQEIFEDIKISVKKDRLGEDIIGKYYAKLRERVTNNAPFKLRAKFDGNDLKVEIMGQVGQKGIWEEQDSVGDYSDSSIGPFSLEVYHFPRAPGKQKGSTLETYYDKRISVDRLENFLRNNYGMYLYRDGAWMKPYGNEMDWLSLEAGARQETRKIGLKQIYGILHLTKELNPGIQPASHRETLIDNKDFQDLKKIMLEIFRILKDYMLEWKLKEKKKAKKEMGINDDNDHDTMDLIIKNLKSKVIQLPPSDRRQSVMALNKIQEIVTERDVEHEKAVEDMGDIRAHDNNLATLGIAASFMARQITKSLEDNMDLVAEGAEMREDIKRNEWKLSPNQALRTEKMLEELSGNQGRMLHFMQFVSVMADHISQSISRNKRPIQVDVLECWENVTNGFQDRKKELGIDIVDDWENPITKKGSEKLVVKIDQIDLESILTNLYLNSIDSLRRIKNRKKEVTFHYWYANGELVIEFSDTGRGIPSSKLEEVFEPFKFGHNLGKNEMHGHGMGLHIVKKIMEKYDGTVEAVDVPEGATIRLTFPKIKKVAT